MSDDLLQHLLLDIDEEDEMEEYLIIILLSTELTMSNRHDPYFSHVWGGQTMSNTPN